MARVPLPSRALLPRRRIDIRRAVTRDFPLKATAVLVALIFWMVSLANAAPTPVVRDFPGRVPVERPEVPAGYVLQAQLGDVGVKLRGTEAALASVVAADLRATLDVAVADLHRADPQDVPLRVTVATPGVQVIEVVPPAANVRIEPITARAVAVQARFANEPPTGTFAGDPAITPAEVRVSGASSQVARIAAMYATVRFGDAVTDLVVSVQPTAVDAAGTTIEGLTVEPAVVQLTVPVLPTATTRTVAVVPAIRGLVASGYWITRVSVDPTVVTVRGENAVLSSIDQVSTSTIDVAGLTDDRTFQVPLLLPAPGTSLIKAAQATVIVSVAPLLGSRPFPLVALQAANLGSGLVAETDPPTIGLILTGTVPALTAVTAGQVVASVDAGGRGPGSYQVDVVVRAPPGTTAQSVQPTRVTLTIRTR
ncbi:MAG TPA: CdaR family protein [Candidatus Limnocylindria bacterium]|nr:CdaR family protein [Candidatus Limnocylindria bacterium]